MIDRGRLIEAAARVYGAFGYRGATTRRIAEEAGVNEITLFRLFGSKARLIDEAVRRCAVAGSRPALPDEPVDPERELTAWCAAHLAWLRAARSVIRKTLGELEERPEAAPCIGQGTAVASRELRDYMHRLVTHGFLPPVRNGRSADSHAARTMLLAAIFSDAMVRDVMPELYPHPVERAAGTYVRLFLRAVGARLTPAAPGRRKASGSPADRARAHARNGSRSSTRLTRHRPIQTA